MQQLSGLRALAFAVALAFATAGSALAQDTTETGAARFDSTDPGAGAIDTAGADTSAMMDRDTSARDTSGVSDTTDTSKVRNPPGYRGMERDTTMFPPTGGPPASPEEAAGQTTGTYSDTASRDTTGAKQNPPGYRGMERPVGGDSAAGHDTTHGASDTTAQTADSAQ